MYLYESGLNKLYYLILFELVVNSKKTAISNENTYSYVNDTGYLWNVAIIMLIS